MIVCVSATAGLIVIETIESSTLFFFPVMCTDLSLKRPIPYCGDIDLWKCPHESKLSHLYLCDLLSSHLFKNYLVNVFMVSRPVHMNISDNLVAEAMNDISDSLCLWFRKRTITRVLLATRLNRRLGWPTDVEVAVKSHPWTRVLRWHILIPQRKLENTYY